MAQRPYNPAEWEDVTPPIPAQAQKPIYNSEEWEDVSPPVPIAPKNWFDKGWDILSTAPKALTDLTNVDPNKTIIEGKPWGGLLEVPGALRDIAGHMFSGDRNVTEAIKRGWHEGATEGAGQFMSPINIADTLTGGGKTKLMRGLNYGVSGLTGAAGVGHVAQGNTFQGLAEIAGGAAGIATGGKPKPAGVRPSLAKQITQADIDALPIPGVKPEVSTPVVDETIVPPTDPNLNAGVGDPNLAGSTPYPHTPIASVDEVDEIIASLGNKPGSAELVNEGVSSNNASGESAASVEAINRQASMKAAGQQFVVYDKTGTKRPLIGPEAVDYRIKEGESFGVEDKDGEFHLLDGEPRPPVQAIPAQPMQVPTGAASSLPSMRAETPPKGPTLPKDRGVTQASQTNQFLQRDLRGAKPRFNIGTTSYEPHFTSDLDKAMFIIAQKSPSRRDADFLAFVMKETGMDEAGARAAGQVVREKIKTLVQGEMGGFVVIPDLSLPIPPKVKNWEHETNPKIAKENLEKAKAHLEKTQAEHNTNPTPSSKFRLQLNKKSVKELEALSNKLNLNKASPNTTAPNRPVVVADGPNSILVRRMDPETLQAAKEQGYELDKDNPVRDDGSVRLTKTGKGGPQPVLETQIPGPRLANIAKSVASGGSPPPPIPPGTGGGTTPSGGPPSSGGTSSGGTGAGGVIPRTRLQKGLSIASDIYNFPRALISSIDFSAPLRQGFGLIHKKQWWTALDDMRKAWGSEAVAEALDKSIRDRPMFRPRVGPKGAIKPSFAEEAGLVLTDLNTLSKREENMFSKLAEHVPLVRRSNRAFVAFLNKLRADVFEDLVTNGKVFQGGKVDMIQAKDFGKFVSIATGRGPLYALEPIAVQLNHGIFSPRLMSSRLHMLNPAYYIMSTPAVRKEHVKSLFAMATVGTVVTQLGRMAGGTVEPDPASSDFGKLKVGNVRLDPYGGMQQYIVAANRLINPFEATGGQRVKSTGPGGKSYNLWNDNPGPYDPSWMEVALRFGRSKAHPVLGFALSLAMNKTEMDGKKMQFGISPGQGFGDLADSTMKNAIVQRFVPLLLQDVYELAKEDLKLAVLLGLPATFGMSVQVNENKRN